MTFTSWLILLVITVLFGTKVVAAIRQYGIQGDESKKAKVKVIDLFVAVVLGALPFIQLLFALGAVIGFVIIVVMETAMFNKGFFNRNLFGGDDD